MKKFLNIKYRQSIKSNILFLIIFFVISNFHTTINAQNEYFEKKVTKRELNEEKWKELTKDLDYSKDVVKPPKEQKIKKVDPEKLKFGGNVLKTVFIIFGILIIVLVMYHLLEGSGLFAPKDKKINPKASNISLEKIEENIHEANFETLIKQALSEKNYSLVIRLSYLSTVKELSQKQLIKWKKDKTNRQYIKEIGNTNFFIPFKEITNIFERVWYGDVPLGKDNFEMIYGKFIQLEQDIKAA